MHHIGHIVNFFKTSDPEDKLAQQLAMESMVRARRYAADDGIQVDLVTTQLPHERTEVPVEFLHAPDLERTIQEFGPEGIPRLPLIGDIIDRLLVTTQAEILLYTNSDIVLLPFFYTAVATLATGYHALEIRRRTLRHRRPDPSAGLSVEDLALLSTEIGITHPGYDCFVFRREHASRYLWRPVCIGIPYIGRAMILNMFAAAGQVRTIADAHLTFHVGDTMRWRSPAHAAAVQFNLASVQDMYRDLWAREGGLPVPLDAMLGKEFFENMTDFRLRS